MVPRVLDGFGQVGRVPVHDGGDHQVQPGRAGLLRLLAAVGDAELLALVQAGLAALAQAGQLLGIGEHLGQGRQGVHQGGASPNNLHTQRSARSIFNKG